MYGFYDDPAVLDVDFHENGRFIFPGTGYPDETGRGLANGLKVNIHYFPQRRRGVPPGFESIVPALVRKYHPEAILCPVRCGRTRRRPTCTSAAHEPIPTRRSWIQCMSWLMSCAEVDCFYLVEEDTPWQMCPESGPRLRHSCRTAS